ncbi:MAG: 4Fe-4S double cluster binding domain-containing protein [bacterium]|nr:4Fe-4S double cluster binding domain-containing protein [bacterium]
MKAMENDIEYRKQLTKELKEVLLEAGASLVGFADLKGIVEDGFPCGVSMAIAIPTQLILSIEDGPNMDYYTLYHDYRSKLNHVALVGERFLREKGYIAKAQTTEVVEEYGNYRTKLPLKTVATRAALGWIGKSALLVTKEYGSAIRLTSLLTDAPLLTATPITNSSCGGCMKCHDACPGKAISGKLWNANMDRDEFFDPIACRKKARELAAEKIQKQITLCGKCFVVCPYTRAYIMREEQKKSNNESDVAATKIE